MKKINKKGFTIVELVIVIAVIGVLAGVLIPTFGGVIASANSSAALQAARGCLSSALNMSSTGSLPGQDKDGVYQTVFFVDQNGDGLVDYQYYYKGNELEAVDRKVGTKWTFNSILLYSDSMLTTYKYTNANDSKTYYTTSSTNPDDAVANSYVEDTSRFTLDTNAANLIYSALNYDNTNNNSGYNKDENGVAKLKGDNATNKLTTTGGIMFNGNDYAPNYKYDSNNKVDVNDSTYCDGTLNKEGTSPITYTPKLNKFYLNSDFSKKVVIFTTFAA